MHWVDGDRTGLSATILGDKCTGKEPKSTVLSVLSAYDHPPMAWYRGDIVVGWCRTRISASNSQVASGHSFGDTITIPFLMDERLICTAGKKRILL